MILFPNHLLRSPCLRRSSIPRALNPRRKIHLWNTTSAGVRFLNKNIINYVDAKELYPNPDDVTIELWPHGDSQSSGQRMTLAKYFQIYAQPGKLLLPRVKRKTPLDGAPQGEKGSAEDIPSYRQILIDSLSSRSHVPKTKKKCKGYTPPHEFYLIAPGPQHTYEVNMLKMWANVGMRHNVETHIRYKQQNPDQATFTRMLAEYVHLRPDVILAAMPEGAGYVIDPQTNYAESCWVMTLVTSKTKGMVFPNVTSNFKRSQRRALETIPAEVKEKRHKAINGLHSQMTAKAQKNGQSTGKSP